MPEILVHSAKTLLRRLRSRELQLVSKTNPITPNPFLPHKNPATNNWREPRYSLRRQADLAKRALALDGIQGLKRLPPSHKVDSLLERVRRVQRTLPPAVRATTPSTASSHTELSFTARTANKYERRHLRRSQVVARHKQKVDQLQKVLEEGQHQNERDQLVALEVKKGIHKETSEGRRDRLARQHTISVRKEMLPQRKALLSKSARRCAIAAERARVTRIELVKEEKWNKIKWSARPVVKVDAAKAKKVKSGLTLYSGRRKMFKGHLWERKRASVVKKRAILMRDMKGRVERYKTYYKKRKPNPLKPSRYTKPPKLPF